MGFRKSITQWFHVIKAGWCSRLMLWGKVFIWRVMVGDLPLGYALKKRNIIKGSYLFCLVELEHVGIDLFHTRWQGWFGGVSFSVDVSNWSKAYLPSIGFLHIWRTMNQCYISKLSSSSWGIGGYGSIGICRICLHFWFASSGEQKYALKLKGLLLWQLTVLEKSRNLNHEERKHCKVNIIIFVIWIGA